MTDHPIPGDLQHHLRPGRDTLTGGTGAEVFVMDRTLPARDKAIDFEDGVDLVDIPDRGHFNFSSNSNHGVLVQWRYGLDGCFGSFIVAGANQPTSGSKI